jgi:hypothetical protein
MVNVISGTDSSGNQHPLWNVDARIGLGSTGTDVMLVQYLLGQALPYVDAGRPQVDGVWGPITAAAMSALEKTYPNDLLADGAVDPLPSAMVFDHGSQWYSYKLAALQGIYCQTRNPAVDPTDLYQSIDALMNTPNDVGLPTALSVVGQFE